MLPQDRMGDPRLQIVAGGGLLGLAASMILSPSPADVDGAGICRRPAAHVTESDAIESQLPFQAHTSALVYNASHVCCCWADQLCQATTNGSNVPDSHCSSADSELIPAVHCSSQRQVSHSDHFGLQEAAAVLSHPLPTR